MLATALNMFASCNKSVEDTKKSKSNQNENYSKSSSPHFDIKIAEISDQKIKFTQQISDIISNLEDNINTGSQLGLDYYTYNIIKEDDMYFLLAKDSIIPATTKVRLVLDHDQFHEYKYNNTPSKEAIGVTCTCSGCKSTGPDSSDECQPKVGTGGYYCSDCSDGDCIKSVTETIGGVLYY